MLKFIILLFWFNVLIASYQIVSQWLNNSISRHYVNIQLIHHQNKRQSDGFF